MNKMDKKPQARYSGAWCSSITPFNQENKIDFLALEKHLQKLDDSGIDGILLMGSIGEFLALSLKERLELIQQARLMSKLPMIVNVSSTCIEEMMQLADASYEAGYQAVMALPHYYYAQSREQVISYYWALNEKFAGDWMIYNYPDRTNCDIDASIVTELASALPKLIGIKDMVSHTTHTRAILYNVSSIRPGFSVFAGYDEYFISNLMNGGAGVMSNLMNIAPELFAQILEAYRQGDLIAVSELHKDICRMTVAYKIGGNFVTTIKTAISNKYHYIGPYARNFCNKLTEEQSQIVAALFK